MRFLTGKGRYTDDINRPGQTYVHFLRSDVAHGAIRKLDVSRGGGDARRDPHLHRRGLQGRRRAALRLAGHRPLRPADEGAASTRSWPTARSATSATRSPRSSPRPTPRPATPPRRSTLDIEELPAVVDMKRGAGRGRGQGPRRPDLEPLLRLGLRRGQQGARSTRPSAARTTSPRSTSSTTASSPNPMEPRGAIGEYDAADDEHTLYTTSQNPHVIRLLMGAFVLGIPEHKLRVVAPDVGGGFGSKIFHYAEEAFVTCAAKVVGRPVKWTSIALRGVHVRRARPRPRDQDRARARQGRQVPRAAHRHAREHGRLSLDLRALHPDLAARHADGRATTPRR